MDRQFALKSAAQIVLLAAAGAFVTLRAGGGHATVALPLDISSLNDAGRPAIACVVQPPAADGYLQTLTRLLVASEELAAPECDR